MTRRRAARRIGGGSGLGRRLAPSLVLLCLAAVVLSGAGAPAGSQAEQADVEMFTRTGCPWCAAGMRFLEDLQRERPGLRVRVHDVVADPAALARLRELAAARGEGAVGVPAFHVRGRLLIGFLSPETTGARLAALLDQPAPAPWERVPQEVLGETVPGAACSPDAAVPCEGANGATADVEAVGVPFLGPVSARDLGLPAFTVVIGLLDGFNPCAMWVLVFLLALLANLRDRARMFLIGGTFVLVSGLVYLAFMAAWLNVFLLIGFTRITQVFLGAVAILIGAINVKDFVAVGRGISLAIPEAAKPGLYARVRRILQAEHLGGALIGVVVLAVLVNTVELACTAGFPALYTHVLALRSLPWWQYYAYLVLYNVAYMLDDAVMLTIAVVTLSRRRLQEREGRWLKLVSGLVMLLLGVSLIAAAGWLGPPLPRR